MKVTNLKKTGLIIIKIIFLIVLCYWVYSLYTEKKETINFTKVSEFLTTQSVFLLIVTGLLSFVNTGIETLKFQHVLLPEKVSFKDALKSVYAGASTGLLTPDRLGNFIGRILHLSQVKNSWVISATFLGNFAQLFATILFATVALFIYPTGIVTLQISESLLSLLRWILFPAVCLMIILYFKSESFLFVVRKIKFLQKTAAYLNKKSNRDKIQILSWATLRYLVFVVQFYLTLNAFGIHLSLSATLVFLGFLYLFTTFIPSPLMGNLGTREGVAVLLLGGNNTLEGVIFSSLYIWLINVLFPAVLGSFFVLKTQKKL